MKENKLSEDFFKYVTLNILGQIAFSCYTLFDTFFVSKSLGADGLTALNLAYPVFCILNGMGLMLGIGGGIKYSILKSRENNEDADKIFTNTIYLDIIFGILFVIIGLFFSKKVVALLGADEKVFNLAHTYVKVLLLFAPFFITNNILQCFIRNDGNPKLSMFIMTIGSLSNIILDYIFIFPMNMGIFGAILATCFSPVICLMMASSYIFKGKNNFHFVKSSHHKTSMREVLSNGIPSLLTELTSGIVMFLFNYIILNIAGNIGVAAFSIITVISLVVIAIYTGLSQGIQPLISYNFGVLNKDNLNRILKYSLISEIVISAIIYLVIYFNANTLALIFNSQKIQSLQNYAVSGLKLYFLACPFIGFNIVIATFFTATGNSKPGKLISLLRGFIILIPIALLLPTYLGIAGVWLSYPLSELIVTIISLILYIRLRKTLYYL